VIRLHLLDTFSVNSLRGKAEEEVVEEEEIPVRLFMIEILPELID
jgi:hypothetical protein